MHLMDRLFASARPRVLKAVIAQDVAAVQTLLAQGADPNRPGTYRQDHIDIPDICGLPIVRQSPLEAAYDMGHSAVPTSGSVTHAIMRALVQAGAKVDRAMSRHVTQQLEFELNIQRKIHPEGYVAYVRDARFTSFLALLDAADMPWTAPITWAQAQPQTPIQMLSQFLEPEQLCKLKGGAQWVAEHRPPRPTMFALPIQGLNIIDHAPPRRRKLS